MTRQEQNQVLATHISVLGLSSQTHNLLIRNQIRTIADLVRRSELDLLEIQGIGESSLEEIHQKLDAFMAGLSAETKDESANFDDGEQYIESLRLPTRVRKILGRANIRTISELGRLSDEELLQVRGLGLRGLWDIKHRLVEFLAGRLPGPNEVSSEIDLDPSGASDKFGLAALGLSKVTRNTLLRSGIVTIADLVSRGDKDLMSIRGLGPISISEIKLKLNEFLAGGDSTTGDKDGQSTISRTAPYESEKAQLLSLWLDLQAQLADELRQGRIHPDLRIRDYSAREWAERDTTDWLAADLFAVIRLFETHLKLRTINDELETLFEELQDRQRAVLAARTGYHKEWTLQEIADGMGLTRERVRQIEIKTRERVLAWLNKRTPWRLRSAILAAEEIGSGISRSSWEHALYKSGLLVPQTTTTTIDEKTPVSIFDFVVACLRVNEQADKPIAEYQLPPNVDRVLEHPGYTSIEVEASRQLTKNDLRHIRRQCKNAGAVSAIIISRQLGKPTDVIANALKLQGYTQISDEWTTSLAYQHAHIQSTYVSAFQANVVKMLSICGPLSAEIVRQGVQAHVSRFDFVVPPTPVLSILLGRIGFHIGTGELVLPLDGVQVAPNGAEQVILETFKRFGFVVTYYELVGAFVEKGISIPGLYTTLRHSVLFQRLDMGLYSLRGSKIAKDDADAAMARRPTIEQDASLQFTADGYISWEINVGAYGMGGSLPAGEASRLAGEWNGRVGGEDVGLVQINAQQVWRLGRAFSRLEIRIGDRVRLIFDPITKSIEISKVNKP
jgi:DNA-directed RNA polymerase alpha subunit